MRDALLSCPTLVGRRLTQTSNETPSPSPSSSTDGSDGSTPWQRFQNAGFQLTSGGENIASGFHDARTVHEAFMGDQGHRDNILGDWTYMGSASCGGCWSEVSNRVGQCIYIREIERLTSVLLLTGIRQLRLGPFRLLLPQLLDGTGSGLRSLSLHHSLTLDVASNKPTIAGSTRAL